MKIRHWLMILIILVTPSCAGSIELYGNATDSNQDSLKRFVVGDWEGKMKVSDENGVYDKYYTLNFTNKGKLIFTMKSPYDGFKDEFVYRFVSDNVVAVENARTKNGEWEIYKEEENLLICVWSNDSCLTFTRINQQKIYLLIAITIALVFFVALGTTRRKLAS